MTPDSSSTRDCRYFRHHKQSLKLSHALCAWQICANAGSFQQLPIQLAEYIEKFQYFNAVAKVYALQCRIFYWTHEFN